LIKQRMSNRLLALMCILAAAFGVCIGAALHPSLPWHAAPLTTTVPLTTVSTITSTVTFATTTEATAVEADFTLPIVGFKGLTGGSLTLSSFRGSVLVLQFIKTSGPVCQEMVPFMEKLYTGYAGKGVVFIAIAGPWDTPSAIGEFIQRYNSSLTYVYDSTGEVFQRYGVKAVPTLFVLSKGGTVTSSYVGAPAYDIIAKAIDEQVAE
jgi:cytochrome c biogenesis protein CcmG/thiol:disulfide interchange protein DsbE